MTSITDRAESAGQQASNSEWIDRAARIGLIAYGVVHVLIGWLAIQLAFGDKEESADSQGAVQQLAEQPFGAGPGVGHRDRHVPARPLAGARGRCSATATRKGSRKVRKRVTSAGKAVVYVVIGITAVRAATGSSSSSGKDGTDSTTAKLMDLPAGQVIVGVVALVILGIGGYLIHKAWTEKFAKYINAEGKSGDTGTAYLWFGKAGYTAKGVAFGIVGALFLYAALTHDPKKSGGLDQALHKVLQQPFGPFLLVLIGLGIACYGLFCFARARHFND